MPRPVHFEIPTDDLERAAAFYSGVFGWELNAWGNQPYWLAKTGEEGEPGIDGALFKREERFDQMVNVIEVPSIDDYLAKVETAGGKTYREKQPVPGVGYAAYFVDTEGNRFGLFENDESAE